MQNDKVKVLIFGMTSIVGGIETFLMNVYDNIDLSNLQIDFLVPGELEEKYKKKIEKRNGKVYEVEKVKKHPIRAIKQLKKLYKDNNYDVIHMNLCNAFFFIYALPAVIANNKNTKIIVHSHNNSDAEKMRHYLLRPIMIHYTDKYLACSIDAGKWMFGKKISESGKVILVSNSIDAEKYKFDEKVRRKVRDELKINDNEFLIGHVGRFDEQKNHNFLIDVFYEYLQINKDSKLLLVGDGGLRTNIEEKVRNLGINENIIFLGVRDDVNELLQACDIFVLPSKFEGFGIVGLEAQTSGLYTIVSTGVVKELDVTNNIEHVALENGSKRWAEEIENKRKILIKREDAYKYVKKSKYDIKNLVKFIKEFYVKCAKEG